MAVHETVLTNAAYRRARLNWLRGCPQPGLMPWLARLLRRFFSGRFLSLAAMSLVSSSRSLPMRTELGAFCQRDRHPCVLLYIIRQALCRLSRRVSIPPALNCLILRERGRARKRRRCLHIGRVRRRHALLGELRHAFAARFSGLDRGGIPFFARNQVAVEAVQPRQ